MYRSPKRHKLNLFERVEADLSKGNHSQAARRLEGYLKHDPLNTCVLDKLATIFYAYGLEERAGRYWYLLFPKNDHRLEAVKAFEKSLGNDPTLILKKLITQTNFAFSRLDNQQLKVLVDLLLSVKEKESATPKFLYALESHSAKRQIKDA